MGLFSRLKRLWELSATKKEVPDIWNKDIVWNKEIVKITQDTLDRATLDYVAPPVVVPHQTGKEEKRMATILQDDPLDIFPTDETEQTNG